MKKPVYIAIVMLCILLLCSCGAEFTPVKTESPTQNPTEVPTQTQSPTTAPTPSQTEAPTPTETVDKEAELKAEINKNIKDFLNAEGKFTQEKIDEMRMPSTNASWIEGPIRLGLMSETNRDSVDIQCGLLGSFEKNGDTVIVTGFDGKDGSRFVTIVKIKTSIYNGIGNYKFGIMGIRGNISQMDVVDELLTNDREIIKSNLEPLIGEVVTLNFPTSDLSKEVLEGYSEDIPELQTIQNNYLKERNGSLDLSKGLASKVYLNEMKLEFKIPKDVKIEKITEIKNIGDEFEIDDSLIPLIEGIFYKAES